MDRPTPESSLPSASASPSSSLVSLAGAESSEGVADEQTLPDPHATLLGDLTVQVIELRQERERLEATLQDEQKKLQRYHREITRGAIRSRSIVRKWREEVDAKVALVRTVKSLHNQLRAKDAQIDSIRASVATQVEELAAVVKDLRIIVEAPVASSGESEVKPVGQPPHALAVMISSETLVSDVDLHEQRQRPSFAAWLKKSFSKSSVTRSQHALHSPEPRIGAEPNGRGRLQGIRNISL